MKEELIEKIVISFRDTNLNMQEIRNRLYMLFNGYKVEAAETQIAIREENKNEWFLQRFLIAKTVNGCTERTIDFYKKELTKTLSKIGKNADEIEADDIRYYLAVREKRDGVSKTTCGNELRCLMSFFSYLQEEGFVIKNPAKKVGTIRCEKRKKEAMTEMEVAKIRSCCNNSKEKVIVELLMSTGCRVSELVNIKIKEIQSGKILVHGKGQKDRVVYLTATAELALNIYLKELAKTKNPYLFPKSKTIAEMKREEVRQPFKKAGTILPEGHMDKGTVEQICRKLGRRAGVENVHPHRFRRTCATMALRRGMPLLQVSKMLGHEQIDTTKIYLDLNEKDLEMAHEKYVI